MAPKMKMPPVQPTVRMPLPDDEKAKAARLRAQNALQQGGGRESTDLTDTANTSFLGY